MSLSPVAVAGARGITGRPRRRAAWIALTASILMGWLLAPAGPTLAATVPSAATDVVGMPLDSAVALTWSAPASTGGSSITGYRVRHSRDGGQSWSSSIATRSTATSFTVPRLRNGRTYVFQVRATNRVGNGPWSATSAPVTPTPAPTPTPMPSPSPTPTPSPAAQSIAVPSYFYPGSLWTQMLGAAPTVGLAVVNPSSGPGSTKDPAYAAQVSQARAAGVLVVGYVDTGYARRDLALVKQEVDRHYDWYGVDGIFFDQVTDSCTSANTTYYAALHAHVKAGYTRDTVVLNPGASTGECYMAISDVVVTYENTYSSYLGWQLSGWEATYPPQKFWHLVTGASAATMPDAVALSRSRNVGWIYVTDDVLPNPWDCLPTYWSSEAALVAGS